jgi:hypothetical protein
VALASGSSNALAALRATGATGAGATGAGATGAVATGAAATGAGATGAAARAAAVRCCDLKSTIAAVHPAAINNTSSADAKTKNRSRVLGFSFLRVTHSRAEGALDLVFDRLAERSSARFRE